MIKLRRESDTVHVATLPDLDYSELLTDRSSEAAMLISRSAGWVLLQAKTNYPPGVFRVPTGTVEDWEDSRTTAIRELHEEANLKTQSSRLLARLHYEAAGQRWEFYSDLFLISRPIGSLKPNDQSEGISGWREAQVSDLADVATDLCGLEGPWKAWGTFRAAVALLSHRLLAKQDERQ
ncbi:MAG: NUDIX hydrolase [Deltaproteobacteria bacterium]|nr:NUDIX hydrolase [Deltaproteobacteria bacterium]